MAAVAVLSSRCGACGQRNEWRVPLAMADRCVADARAGRMPPRECGGCRGRIGPDAIALDNGVRLWPPRGIAAAPTRPTPEDPAWLHVSLPDGCGTATITARMHSRVLGRVRVDTATGEAVTERAPGTSDAEGDLLSRVEAMVAGPRMPRGGTTSQALANAVRGRCRSVPLIGGVLSDRPASRQWRR